MERLFLVLKIALIIYHYMRQEIFVLKQRLDYQRFASNKSSIFRREETLICRQNTIFI